MITGAKGTTTLQYSSERLTVSPDQRDAAEETPEICRAPIDLLKLVDNDGVVISSADIFERAEHGALAAALSLIDWSDA